MTIASMGVGDSGWTVPWAMYRTRWMRRLRLNGNYTIHPCPGGTSTMRVWRDEDGWHVNASACPDQEWQPANYHNRFIPVPIASLEVDPPSRDAPKASP